jgi:hypothetical protein
MSATQESSKQVMTSIPQRVSSKRRPVPATFNQIMDNIEAHSAITRTQSCLESNDGHRGEFYECK